MPWVFLYLPFHVLHPLPFLKKERGEKDIPCKHSDKMPGILGFYSNNGAHYLNDNIKGNYIDEELHGLCVCE